MKAVQPMPSSRLLFPKSRQHLPEPFKSPFGAQCCGEYDGFCFTPEIKHGNKSSKSEIRNPKFMKLTIKPNQSKALYQQVVDQIQIAIKTGKLRAGDKLPSLRELAYKNKIAVNTVGRAFKELEKNKLIESKHQRAYHVYDSKTTLQQNDRYAARGVSSTKAEVHATVDHLERGLFPRAFCKITEDYLTGDPNKCNIIHADGSGTKSNVAYLHYRETGDSCVFRGIAQDSVVMNIDDLLCVGATERILLSNTVNRNARNFPGEALAQLILGTEAFLNTLRGYGITINSGGGETADVGDLTGTVTVDSCAVAMMDKTAVITGNDIKPGLAILGIASAGQAIYEDMENSGIGSNGLTSARHDLLSPYYRKKYPETYDSGTPKNLVYCGPYKLDDPLPDSPLTVGQALLSPTRTYAPIITKLLQAYPGKIKGLIHCSGGGQTKCLRFGQNVHFVKNNLLPIPPIFKAIQKASGTSWKEMYQVYNMGHRMEVYCSASMVPKMLNTIREFGVDAEQIGYTENSTQADKSNHLSLFHGKRKLHYQHP